MVPREGTLLEKDMLGFSVGDRKIQWIPCDPWEERERDRVLEMDLCSRLWNVWGLQHFLHMDHQISMTDRKTNPKRLLGYVFHWLPVCMEPMQLLNQLSWSCIGSRMLEIYLSGTTWRFILLNYHGLIYIYVKH